MSDTYFPIVAPAHRPVTVVEVERAPVCPECGMTLALDGSCLEVGSCRIADDRAVRGSARVTAKYAVPAAWNARGYVD